MSGTSHGMTEEVLVFDFSGQKKRTSPGSDSFAEDKGLGENVLTMKYNFQVVRVECRLKWKLSGHGAAVLKLKCGPKRNPDKPKSTKTLVSCKDDVLEKTFNLEPEPDVMDTIWEEKKAGKLSISKSVFVFEGSDFSRHLHVFR